MIAYNKYTDNRDHTWYNSSNVLYSKCIDTETDLKTLEIVFKQGRTYLYRDVTVDDYIMFKNAGSNGEAFNKFIRKYDCVRLPDTDLDELSKLMETFQKEDGETSEAFSNLQYALAVDDRTGEFELRLNGRTIFSGIEGKVSIVRLLKSMCIAYTMIDKTTTEDGDGSEH